MFSINSPSDSLNTHLAGGEIKFCCRKRMRPSTPVICRPSLKCVYRAKYKWCSKEVSFDKILHILSKNPHYMKSMICIYLFVCFLLKRKADGEC